MVEMFRNIYQGGKRQWNGPSGYGPSGYRPSGLEPEVGYIRCLSEGECFLMVG